MAGCVEESNYARLELLSLFCFFCAQMSVMLWMPLRRDCPKVWCCCCMIKFKKPCRRHSAENLWDALDGRRWPLYLPVVNNFVSPCCRSERSVQASVLAARDGHTAALNVHSCPCFVPVALFCFFLLLFSFLCSCFMQWWWGIQCNHGGVKFICIKSNLVKIKRDENKPFGELCNAIHSCL